MRHKFFAFVLLLLLPSALIQGCSSKDSRPGLSSDILKDVEPISISYRELIRNYMESVAGRENDESEIDEQFIETFKDSNETAIALAQTEKIEFFTAGNGFIFAVYSLDNGFFKYGVLFRPDLTPYKVIVLGYRFGNNEFHVERSYHIERKKPLTLKVTDRRYETEWTGNPGKEGRKILNYERSYMVTLDSGGGISLKTEVMEEDR